MNKTIPNINKYPLHYVFEDMKLIHKPDTLWLEFGVASGRTINYISQFTTEKVYGFDSFEGLSEKWWLSFEKGAFNMNGTLPQVNENVELIKGWFNETLLPFIQLHNKKISFIHMDTDLYSSTKYIFDIVKDYIDTDCIFVFDELVNCPEDDTEEIKTFCEYILENNVEYEWIGMNRIPINMNGYYHENIAVIIRSIIKNEVQGLIEVAQVEVQGLIEVDQGYEDQRLIEVDQVDEDQGLIEVDQVDDAPEDGKEAISDGQDCQPIDLGV